MQTARLNQLDGEVDRAHEIYAVVAALDAWSDWPKGKPINEQLAGIFTTLRTQDVVDPTPCAALASAMDR